MSTRRALGILTLVEVLSFTLNFTSVIILSRLLTPTEIGIYSVSVSLLGIAHLFREFGVGQYLIQVKEFGQQQLRAAFTVTLIAAWSIAAILFIVRGPVVSFYGNEGVAEVLGLLAATFLIMPFGTPLLAVLRRQLEFGKIAFVEICSVITQVSVTIGAALAGESYLSMAWGAIAQHAVRVIILNIIRPGDVFLLPTTHGIPDVLKFGSYLSLNSLVAAFGDAAPSLIFGRTLGFTDVAFYSRADGLRGMIIQNLSKVVRGVYFPTFAQKIRAGGNASQLYCQSVNYYFSIAGPAMALLAFLSEPIIYILFGDQWIRSAPLASLICMFSIITAPYMPWSETVIATGNVRMLARITIATQLVRIGILMSSIWFSLEQVVALMGISFAANAVAFQIALRQSIGLNFVKLIRSLRSSILLIPITLAAPVTASISMKNWFPGEELYFHTIMICGILALCSWLMGIFMLNHEMKAELYLFYQIFRERIMRRL